MGDVQDRLTVVESVYHHGVNRKPECVETRFERRLQSVEQMYVRHKMATEKWEPLDCGWFADAERIGMLVIQNDEGRDMQVIPTNEERDDIAQRVLEVSFGMPSPDDKKDRWFVLPGEKLTGVPSDATRLNVRSQHGPINYTVNIIPG